MESEGKIIQLSDEIILKQVEFSDAQDIFSTIDSQREYLGKWLPFVSNTRTVKDSEAFVKSILDIPLSRREYVFVIKYCNNFAGMIGFKDSDNFNRKTEIGYWLSKDLQKKGIVTKSVRALIEFAFFELHFNRVQIKCAVANTLSRNIPIRLGFEFEGIERDGELLSNGIFTDIEVYSLLRSDLQSKDE